MRGPEQPQRGSPEQEIPPFWIAKSEDGSAQVDERVLAEAEKLWPWCYRLVVGRLRDGPSAAQILEEVALKVSRRLGAEERVGERLRAYVIKSFIRRVNDLVERNGRMRYCGLARDLESLQLPAPPDWALDVEKELLFEALSLYLDSMAVRMLNFRCLDHSWRFIGNQFGLSPKQASNAFSYRLEQAVRALFGRGDRHEGESR